MSTSELISNASVVHDEDGSCSVSHVPVTKASVENSGKEEVYADMRPTRNAAKRDRVCYDCDNEMDESAPKRTPEGKRITTKQQKSSTSSQDPISL